MNDEDCGTLLPDGPVDVHLHGIAPHKSPGAPLHPDGMMNRMVAPRRLERARFNAANGRGDQLSQSADARLLASEWDRG